MPHDKPHLPGLEYLIKINNSLEGGIGFKLSTHDIANYTGTLLKSLEKNSIKFTRFIKILRESQPLVSKKKVSKIYEFAKNTSNNDLIELRDLHSKILEVFKVDIGTKDGGD